jgi:hypothetical protein
LQQPLAFLAFWGLHRVVSCACPDIVQNFPGSYDVLGNVLTLADDAGAFRYAP